jgi:hypothetical protein
MRRIIEEATQTFLNGTPVSLASGDGGVQAWGGTNAALLGFCKEAANNLAATGVIPTAAVNPATQPKFGSVPNEASAANISRPFFLDGRIAVEIAVADTVFIGQTNDTVTAANVGKSYGITKDTDNHWYVDLTNTTNLVVTIVRLDPNDQLATHNRGVYFVINGPSTNFLGPQIVA